MNNKALNILEYTQIRDQVSEYSQNPVSAALIRALEPKSDIEWIQAELAKLDEARVIHMQASEPGMSTLSEVKPLTKRASIGSMLSVPELNRIKNNIRVTNRYKTYVLNMTEDGDVSLPLLRSRFLSLPVLSHISDEIDEKCDETTLYDNASSALYDIRQQKKTINRRIKDKLDSIVRSSANQKKLSDAIVTIRNDRQVIPVRSEYKQDFPGIVHDTSASGQTFYIEPNSIVELSGQLNTISARENEEVSRILYELSAHVAEVQHDIDWVTTVMGELDFQLAKAKYGHSINGVIAEIADERTIELPLAWHPLLDKETVVKNSIIFGDDIDAVIITGPNTGGKTVTLKTVGLLIAMNQSGMMIPAGVGSRLSIFKEVFCDIGDEQSIEQSLSTFSSHMTNIVSILKSMDEQSLVLFDELGAGTDPSEGAALAMSILDRCLEANVMTMATTHYPELKAYSYNREGVMNASVEFDVQTLSPTYKLLMGVPGKSNAFEISKKLGLDLSIIKNARQLIHMDNIEINDMISALEKNTRQAENDRVEMARLKKEAAELHQELAEQFESYQQMKSTLIENAKANANDIVAKAEKDADAIIKDLKNLRSEHQTIKENELIDQKGKFKDLYNEGTLKKQAKQQEAEKIEAGDNVKVLSYGQKGVILSVDKDEAVVQMGIIKMKLPLTDFKKEKPEKEKQIRVVPRANRQTIKMELDLRGERYEDALQRLENYLDQAILSNYNQVTIIHGKGTGALQKGVQSYLKRAKGVASYRGGMPSEGGFGVTVVELK
ncbi:endonuclease MutS2 [Macrococcus hajekii]|uniref:Endonuclease MutS2 n=1 Tax=Macrococcus hajekii TaxID=198482 RepID=A0A4R6BM16_9STAP|nr:endonuclease MutS2 [Macrococcus hajekii]TDM02771.1 endonuclease MutS2 [Macrococcus hajekii]GGB03779.1 endonuclease MutS2 [Macrococcus hajekii]